MDFKDGYQTCSTFGLDDNLQFWEKTVKPPSLKAGGAIDTTTMKNQTVRTRFPKSLVDIGESNMVGAWAHGTYEEIMAMIGVNQQITLTFPDGSTTVYWGWIDEFDPDDMEEGEHPTSSILIIPSNVDNTGAESLPVHTTAP